MFRVQGFGAQGVEFKFHDVCFGLGSWFLA